MTFDLTPLPRRGGRPGVRPWPLLAARGLRRRGGAQVGDPGHRRRAGGGPAGGGSGGPVSSTVLAKFKFIRPTV